MITEISPPAAEPLLLKEVKGQLRIEHDDEDDLIVGHMRAARQYLENSYGFRMITQSWRYSLDAFPAYEIKLPFRPLQSVSSITYIDQQEVEQTLSTDIYDVDTVSHNPRVTLAYGESWPSTYDVPNAVSVNCVLGFGDDGAYVPPEILIALKLLIGHLYENREATAPSSVGIAEIPIGYKSFVVSYGLWR